MNRKPAGNSAIKLGRGRPFSRDALKVLWMAVISKSSANDWVKGRVIAMIFSTLILIWALSGVMDLVSPGMSVEIAPTELMAAGLEIGSEQDILSSEQSSSNIKLRNDLFKILKPEKEKEKKAPQTNPVELLALIELQGVLGGRSPRAIVLYKRTKKTSTVSVGDDLGEFKVVEIRDRSVILKWREELFELSL